MFIVTFIFKFLLLLNFINTDFKPLIQLLFLTLFFFAFSCDLCIFIIIQDSVLSITASPWTHCGIQAASDALSLNTHHSLYLAVYATGRGYTYVNMFRMIDTINHIRRLKFFYVRKKYKKF